MSVSGSNDDDVRWRDRVVGNAQVPLPEPWFIRDARGPDADRPRAPRRDDDDDVLPMTPPRPDDELLSMVGPRRDDDGVLPMTPPGARRPVVPPVGVDVPPRRRRPARPPYWLLAVGAVIVALIAAALWLTAPAKQGGAPTTAADDTLPATPIAPAALAPSACTRPETLAQLRGVLVGLARRAGGGDNLERRAASLSISVAAAPDVAAGDGRSVACRGAATIEGYGEAPVATSLSYRVRPAADGGVAISSLRGAAPLVAALTRPEPVLASPDPEPASSEPEATPVEPIIEPRAEVRPEPRIAPPVEIRPQPRVEPRPEPRAEPVERPRAPPPVARAEPRPVPPRTEALPAPPRSEPRVRFAYPSFDCRGVTSRVLRTVCADEDLSALDRDMADLFAAVRESADDQLRDELEAGRDAFIARRQRCTTTACIARTYDERIAELEALR